MKIVDVIQSPVQYVLAPLPTVEEWLGNLQSCTYLGKAALTRLEIATFKTATTPSHHHCLRFAFNTTKYNWISCLLDCHFATYPCQCWSLTTPKYNPTSDLAEAVIRRRVHVMDIAPWIWNSKARRLRHNYVIHIGKYGIKKKLQQQTTNGAYLLAKIACKDETKMLIKMFFV